MKPFLLLATRAENEAADGEYQAFLEAGCLRAEQLERIRLEAAPMPHLDLDDYSGIIVGGSPFNASDPLGDKDDIQLRVEREFARLLDDVVARDIPFFGACYGIGLLGSHLGGTVDRRWSEPVGPTRITLTPEGEADPVFGAVTGSFDAFVGHKEACSALPSGAVLLATGEACPVQAFRVGRNVYATQFHPELTVSGIIARIRVYREYGYFAPEETDELIASIESAVVTEPARLIARFVEVHATKG